MGDILPSAITTMAQAAHDAGITVDATTKSLYEAMEAGEVMSEDVLPHFGKRMWEAANRGGALQAAINNTGAAYGRLGTNIRMANKTFNEAGLDKGMRRLTNSISDFLLKSEGLIKFFGMLSGEIASRFGVVFEVLETLGYWSTKLSDTLGKLEEKGIDLDIAFMALSGTLALISKWFRRIFLFVYLLPWALSKTADTLKGNFGDDVVDSISRVVAVLMTLYGTLRLIRGVKTGLGSLFGGGRRGVPPLHPDVAGPAARTSVLSSIVGHLSRLASVVAGGKLSVAVLTIFGLTSIAALIVDAFRNNRSVNTSSSTGASNFGSLVSDLEDGKYSGDVVTPSDIQPLTRLSESLRNLGSSGSTGASRFGSLAEQARSGAFSQQRNGDRPSWSISEDAWQRFDTMMDRFYGVPSTRTGEQAREYLVQGGITIHVDGAGDPQVVSEEVLRTIQNVFRETASLEPETEQ